jgi:hypothetical protein
MRRVSLSFLTVLLLLAPWLVLSPGSPATAAGVPATGYLTTDFVTNLPFSSSVGPIGVGPIGVAFDATGRLLIADIVTQGFYAVGPAGTSSPSPLSVGSAGGGLAFGKTGQLYAVQRDPTTGVSAVVQLDPATGAVVRTLISNNSDTVGLAADPISGDLFFSQPNIATANIVRIKNPAAANPVTETYASPGTTDGIVFGSDGTMYTVSDSGSGRCVKRTTATSGPQPPLVTTVVCQPAGPSEGWDGIAVAADSSSAPTLFVNSNNGSIRRITQSTTPATMAFVATGGTRGDFVTVGPDGCLYATQTSSIEKVSNADGSCTLVPTSVAPTLRLMPVAVDPRLVGQSVTFTATITNVANPVGTPVTFTVSGANPRTFTTQALSGGTATFSYTGTAIGDDTVTATTAGSPPLGSNAVTVAWENATLTLSRPSGNFQTPVTATGAGFAAGETVVVYANATSGTPLFTASANGSGGFSVTYPVPQAPGGRYTLYAVGATSGRRGQAAFQVTPKLLVNRTAAYAGTAISVAVYGYLASEPVTVGLAAPSGPCCPTTLATMTANSKGSATATRLAPSLPASIAGNDYSLVAQGATTSLTSAFQMVATLTVTPTAGPAGTQPLIGGTGFTPNQPVTLIWNCALSTCPQTTVIGTTTADANGYISVIDAAMPADAQGSHTIGALGSGFTFASAVFTLT